MIMVNCITIQNQTCSKTITKNHLYREIYSSKKKLNDHRSIGNNQLSLSITHLYDHKKKSVWSDSENSLYSQFSSKFLETWSFKWNIFIGFILENFFFIVQNFRLLEVLTQKFSLKIFKLGFFLRRRKIPFFVLSLVSIFLLKENF